MSKLYSVLGLAVVGAIGVSGSAFAAADADAVTAGTGALQTGADTMTSFFYAALPILIGVAVALAIVRWVVSKVKGGSARA